MRKDDAADEEFTAKKYPRNELPRASDDLEGRDPKSAR